MMAMLVYPDQRSVFDGVRCVRMDPAPTPVPPVADVGVVTQTASSCAPQKSAQFQSGETFYRAKFFRTRPDAIGAAVRILILQ